MKRRSEKEDMQPEYDFDYTKAKPNRFAGRIAKDRLVVLLDPEVSRFLPTPSLLMRLLDS